MKQGYPYYRGRLFVAVWLWAMLAMCGCAVVPDVMHKPTVYNPFPQLHKVAVLPFFNQSKEPTVDGDSIAIAYYNELQQVPGFEVMPVGVVKQVLVGSQFEPRSGADFQKLARMLGVDAVIVGSVTEYSPYYPPRLGLSIDWYAANPGFHPIPAGYGLPWGTADEEFIPESLKREAEFALAREQLATQTPEILEEPASTQQPPAETNESTSARGSTVKRVTRLQLSEPANLSPEPELLPEPLQLEAKAAPAPNANTASLPGDWPDPLGFVPAQPEPHRAASRPQFKPIMTHTKLYSGRDGEFTERLARYYDHQDDARFGGWQAYLQRPEDFTRFCCHLHVTETLVARGGAGKTELILRWPTNR